jgi:broad specificity phosphatase PhoE/tetratricopeptide (TPR) repeat protein
VETLLNHLGRISRRLGNRALALEYHKKVLTAAGEQSGAESQGVIEAHRCLARLYRDFGRWADAAASLETSRQIARSQGDRYDEALAISRKAEIECLLGSWQEARLDCSVALGMLSKYENDLALAGTFENTGRLSTWVGANDEALSNYISALWCYTRLSAKVGIALSFVDLARHYQLENVLSRALEYSAQASAIAQGVGDLVLKAVALNVNANARRLSGDASQAAEAFRANLKCLEEGGDSYHAAEAAIGVAACLLQEGKDTSQALKDAHKHLDGSNYPDLASKYKVIVGLAARRSGKRMAQKIISEGICDAGKFSPRLAESLRSELSVLWNVRIASSDPETARTNTMSDDILESISVAAGPDRLKLKLPAPLLKVRRGQKLVVLHHGLSSMRHDGRIQGRIDAGLMHDCRPAIVANSKAITERLQGLGVDLRTIRVLSAPARRAYETAFIVVDELRGQSRQIPVLRVRRSLENIGLGDWEGQRKQDLAMSENWIALSSGRNFSVAAPGRSADGTSPESLREVINRVYSVLSDLVEDDASAILVGHKMSLIIPAILLFSPTLLVDADQVLNWRAFDFSPGTGLIISEDSIERVAGCMIG